MPNESAAYTPSGNPPFDGVPVKLADGKTYIIPPFTLRQLKRIAEKMRGIVEPSLAMGGDQINDILDVVHEAFRRNYPEITKDDLEDIIDIRCLRELLPAMAGVNGMERAKPGEAVPGAEGSP